MNGDIPSHQRPRVVDAEEPPADPVGRFAASRRGGCGCSGCLGCLGTVAAVVLLISFLDVALAAVSIALPGFVTGAICVLVVLGIFKLAKSFFS